MSSLMRGIFLDLCSLRSEFFYNVVQPVFVDRAKAFGRDLQGDPLVFFGEEEAFGLQVGQEPAIGLDIRVRHFVAGYRNFTRDLTYSRHDAKNLDCKGRKRLINNQKKSGFSNFFSGEIARWP
jgi:hypothetical protein